MGLLWLPVVVVVLWVALSLWGRSRSRLKVTGDATIDRSIFAWMKDRASLEDRVLVMMMAFDMQREGHRLADAQSAAVLTVYALANSDAAIERKHNQSVRAGRDAAFAVLGKYENDSAWQSGFRTFVANQVGEDFDPDPIVQKIAPRLLLQAALNFS